MNLLLTVFTSLLFIVFSWYIFRQKKKSGSGFRFSILYSYRIVFLVVQIIIYDRFYGGICDTSIFYNKLSVICTDIKNNPEDLILFYSGSYKDMALDLNEKTYLY